MSDAAPWTADRELDAAGAAAAIYEAVPKLAGTEVRRLGSGWDCDAYEAGRRWLFRFPRRKEGQASMLKDLCVLRWIADGGAGPAFAGLLGRHPWRASALPRRISMMRPQ